MTAEESSGVQMSGWELFFDRLGAFLRENGRRLGNCSDSYAHHAAERLEICIGSVSRLKTHLEDNLENVPHDNRTIILDYKNRMSVLLTYLQSLGREWQHYINAQERISDSQRYSVSASQSVSGRGRPRFIVLKDQLEYLHSLSFTWTEIASLLGVSRMTLYRRRQEFGLLDDPTRTISDTELRRKILEIKGMLPTVGEKIILGQLRAQGFHVTRCRVREIIRATDPINTALRWQGTVTARRSYSVPGPNSLWHIGKYILSLHDLILIE